MTLSKRPYCTACGYPQLTCVCHAVAAMPTQTRVDILQHPSEVKSAKNTARLVRLCVPSCRLWVGETEQDFNEIRQSVAAEKNSVVVLYPDEAAIALNEVTAQADSGLPSRILLIDGTWKKAYKIWQLNPWLHDLTSVKITNQVSRYDIRKSPNQEALSTLEALAFSLQVLEPAVSTQPLFDVFNAMQKSFKVHQAAANRKSIRKPG